MTYHTLTTTTTLSTTPNGMFAVFHKGVTKAAYQLHVKRNYADAIELYNKLVALATGARNFVEPELTHL